MHEEVSCLTSIRDRSRIMKNGGMMAINKSDCERTGFKLSVCIPCFNEAGGIEGTVEEVARALKELLADDEAGEIILVDDGSTDATRSIIDRLQAEQSTEEVRIVAIGFDRNLGRGAAIRAGIAASCGRFVACLDADLSYDTSHLARIMQSFVDNPSTDVVVVSPYMRGGTTSGVPAGRLILSKAANWILAGFFEGRLRTVTCVVRGYRGDFVRSLPIQANGKGAHLEMLRIAALMGGHIVEIPGHLAWRKERRIENRRWLPGSKLTTSARQHVLYGMLVRPSRLLKYLALLLALIAGYEFIAIGFETIGSWGDSGGFFDNAWVALREVFMRSPHSFVIFGIASVISLQIGLFLVVLKVLQLQQEETMRMLIGLHRSPSKSESEACAD